MKVFKWTVAVMLPMIGACNPHSLVPPMPDPQQVAQHEFPASLENKLDVLFMVDNSSSMASLQKKLIEQFPSFMEPLKRVPTPDGSGVALPNIHVAVVSSDTGPGKIDEQQYGRSFGCRLGGDQGQFQYAPRDDCTKSPLHTAPTQQTFLAASMNQTVTNFDGDISAAFGCIAALGQTGCGFEGQLKSVRWALDPANTPDANVGFLRPDATLAVVLITNEDDCSVPDDSDLIDPSQTLMSDPLGPFWSFRCNEFGHLCNINGTMQPPPRGPADHLQGCVSNETPSGRLTRVGDEVAFLKGLKTDPSRIVVAAITGLPTDYSIEMIKNKDDVEYHPNIKPSCGVSAGEHGDPAVRLLQWVSAFGDHGLAESICADSLQPALQAIAERIAVSIGPQCVSGSLMDRDPSTPELDPECQVMDVYTDAQKQQHQTALQACAVDATAPCWSLVDDAKCPGAKKLEVTRAGGALPDTLHTTISCSLCIAGVARPGCPSLVTHSNRVGTQADRVAGTDDCAGAGVVVVLAGAVGVGPATVAVGVRTRLADAAGAPIGAACHTRALLIGVAVGVGGAAPAHRRASDDARAGVVDGDARASRQAGVVVGHPVGAADGRDDVGTNAAAIDAGISDPAARAGRAAGAGRAARARSHAARANSATHAGRAAGAGDLAAGSAAARAGVPARAGRAAGAGDDVDVAAAAAPAVRDDRDRSAAGDQRRGTRGDQHQGERSPERQ